MEKFIYVFTPEDAETLIRCGYDIVKSNIKSNVFIFEADEHLMFSSDCGELDNVHYMLSNKLTF